MRASPVAGKPGGEVQRHCRVLHSCAELPVRFTLLFARKGRSLQRGHVQISNACLQARCRLPHSRRARHRVAYRWIQSKMLEGDELDMLLELAGDFETDSSAKGCTNATDEGSAAGAAQQHVPASPAADDIVDEDLDGVLAALADEAEARMVPGSPSSAALPFDPDESPACEAQQQQPQHRHPDHAHRSGRQPRAAAGQQAKAQAAAAAAAGPPKDRPTGMQYDDEHWSTLSADGEKLLSLW